ncbi:MAG TPA: 4-alpha-glucanotransferase [Vicinamibacteria bacterium]|nr:4-alpha-glucanotransferase [Vicinamibacteria bacterium]
MASRRKSGILLHPTSLPGPFGIGDLGPEAHGFVDFLAAAGQRLWQVLPLGPTGFGDSPYQSFSAFAGNPLLISPQRLVQDGLIDEAELKPPAFAPDAVDYGAVIEFKLPLLERAFRRFKEHAAPAARRAFAAFRRRQAGWLDDYALFAALKEAHGGAAWNEWEEEIALRRPAALARWRERASAAVEARQFWQYHFFRQWAALKRRAARAGVEVMGDVPIFVAQDSADVWAHPELFQLGEDGTPAAVAGVPPDYFSETGQLWGNPLYRWDVMAETGYRWWIDRLRAILDVVDVVRLDHFRGFESYWAVPAGEETAINGRWVKGPGDALFDALRNALGRLPIVAENLGVITPEVEALRERFSLPGMAVLQFAFGGGDADSDFLPHNYTRDRVVYTGTHDNDTTVGWWMAGAGDTTRTDDQAERERAFAKKYLATDGWEIHWAFIRAALASVADLAIVPLQDVLGQGSEARMNLPARAEGNWRWRFRSGALTPEIRDRLRELAVIYGRVSVKAEPGPA